MIRSNLYIYVFVLCFVVFSIFTLFYYIKKEQEEKIKQIRYSEGGDKTKLIYDNMDLITKKLKPGMSLNEVENILGLPQNEDHKDVWIWINDFNLYKKQHQKLLWQEMALGNGGLFLVFFEGKLLTPFPYACASASPIEVLASMKQIPSQEAARILGVELPPKMRVPSNAGLFE